MYKSMLAGAALVAVAAVASPMVGWSADTGAQTAQAEPGQGGFWHHRHEGAGGRHRQANMSPQQRCEDRLARQAGLVAYVVAKLNLTAEQKPLWSQVQGALQAAADKQRALCATLKPADQRGTQTMLDRLDRRQQMLQARIEAIQQVKPALQAFYQALTPDQRAIVDHPLRRS